MITYRKPFDGEYPVSQGYGDVITSDFHSGIDYALPIGTEVLSSAEGTVVSAGWDYTGYGNFVILQHTTDRATLYGHLSDVRVKAGEAVKQGQVIGLSGNTGNSTGPHLHFEARTQAAVFASHFNPEELPLAGVTESGEVKERKLIEPDELGTKVVVCAPYGAKGFSEDFRYTEAIFSCGREMCFTGQTTARNGYTYCEVYPEPKKYWVAVHDGETQILRNR